MLAALTLAQYSHDDHMWGWGGWWMVVGMVAFWALVIGVVLLLVHVVGSDGRQSEKPGRSSDRAAEILAERYARGEISTEEFRERRETLNAP